MPRKRVYDTPVGETTHSDFGVPKTVELRARLKQLRDNIKEMQSQGLEPDRSILAECNILARVLNTGSDWPEEDERSGSWRKRYPSVVKK